MIRSPFSLSPIVFGLVVGPILAGSAMAQTPTPTPAAEALVGPLVPGVCVLGREAVFANSKIGVAATARIQELSKQAQSEIDAERRPIEADLKVLEAQKASLTQAQLDERGKPLAARWAALQGKASLRAREIDATRAKALGRIAIEAQPIVAQVYAGRKCGMLFAREMMLGGNPGADLTAAVVQGLDAKITTITVPRETLPADGAPVAGPLTAPPAAAPAAPKAR